MLLSGFDLAGWIQQLNKTKNKQYALNETFGFDFFKETELESTKEVIRTIYHQIEANFFTADEKASLGQYQQTLNSKLASLYNELIPKPKLEINPQMSSVHAKNNYLNWIRYQKQQLDDAAVWENASLEEHHAQKLKRHWQQRSKFIAHTHDALITAAKNLSVLIHHHQLIAENWYSLPNRLRMPTLIYKAYSNYLSEFFKIAHQHQQQIAFEMQQRLRDWDQHQTTQQYIYRLQQQLKNQTSLRRTMPTYVEKFSPQSINAFHKYIYKKGAPDTKAELQRRSWFSAAITPFATELHRYGKQQLIVPRGFSSRIPVSLPKLPWLFKGAALRYKFFQNKVGLLANLKRSPDIENYFVNLTNPEEWQSLLVGIKDQEDAVNKAITELKCDKYSSFSRFFYRSTRQFLLDWNEVLQVHRKLQIQNKIILAKKLNYALVHQYAGNTVQIAIHSWQTCHVIKTLINEIRANLKTYQLTDPLLSEQIEIIQNQTKQYLKLNRIFQYLERLAKHDILSEKEWSDCNNYLDFLAHENQENYQSFLNLCLPQRTLIFTRLKQLLENSFTTNQPKIIAQTVNQLMLFTIKYGFQDDKISLETSVKKGFLCYLNELLKFLKNGDKDDQKCFQSQWELMSMICSNMERMLGQPICYAGKPIVEYLYSLRVDAASYTVLVCKTQVLISSLAEEFIKTRVRNDIRQFDLLIEDYIINNLNLGYQRSHVSILMRLRDRALNKNLSMEGLSGELREDEKVMVGLANSETHVVKTLLNASILGQQARLLMRDKSVSLVQKIQLLNALNINLNNMLSGSLEATSVKQLLTAKSGHRLLFYQSYVDINLLKLESSKICEEDAGETLTYN